MTIPPHPVEPEPPRSTGVRPYLRSTTAAAPDAATGPGAPAPGPSPTSLRPFVMTSGRVDGADPDIGIETQVTTHKGVMPAGLSPEQRAIVSLCVQPMSVAEISARLRLHLGVTRILVGDLRAAGQLDVHVLADEFPDPETIMRVIRGLRAIS